MVAPIGVLVTVGTEPVGCCAATFCGAGTLSNTARNPITKNIPKKDFKQLRIVTPISVKFSKGDYNRNYGTANLSR